MYSNPQTFKSDILSLGIAYPVRSLATGTGVEYGFS